MSIKIAWGVHVSLLNMVKISSRGSNICLKGLWMEYLTEDQMKAVEVVDEFCEEHGLCMHVV